MSRLVQAAKHYGMPKKRYKFEMHIHRVVLTSEKRKLFTRVLWSRGKNKNKHKHKHNPSLRNTKWCEGVENYSIDESIHDTATIYFTNNTNIIQPKHTKITIQIRDRIDGKNCKFAKFSLDLSKYVDLSQPHRVFYQRLNYEKARKKAQLIFTIKSNQITHDKSDRSDGSVSDYTDEELSVSEYDSHSNYTDYNTDDDESVLSLNTLHNATANAIKKSPKTHKSPIKSPKTHKSPMKSPKTAPLHSNISGNKLKTRYFDQKSEQNLKVERSKSRSKEESPTPTPTPSISIGSNASNLSSVTITRRKESNEKFVRASQFQFGANDKTQSHSTPRHHTTNSISDKYESSVSETDVRELQRKLKMYEDKHKKYKYKYARLCKKVEEQEIEARCQQDQICSLKRVEEDIKDQYHTMAKYKKKIKSLTKERESLRTTLQKRNQTIINLNKRNAKLKQQIQALQTLDLERDLEFDDNITEFNPNHRYKISQSETESESESESKEENTLNLSSVNKESNADIAIKGLESKALETKHELTVNKSIDSINGKSEESTTNTTMTPPTQIPQKRHSLHIKNSDQISKDIIAQLLIESPKETDFEQINGEKESEDKVSEEIIKLVQTKQKQLMSMDTDTAAVTENALKTDENVLKEIKNQWMLAETERQNYKKLYEKEKTRVSHYKGKTSVASKKYEKSEIELSIAKHEIEELQQKSEIMQQSYFRLKQDLSKIMNRYSKLEMEYDKLTQNNDKCLSEDIDESDSV